MINRVLFLLVVCFGLIISVSGQVYTGTVLQTGVTPNLPTNLGAAPGYSGNTPIIFRATNGITLTTGFSSGIPSPSQGFFLAILSVGQMYGELKMQVDGSYYPTVVGALNFTYEEKYAGGTLKMTIYDNSMNVVISNVVPAPNTIPSTWGISTVFGKNYFSWDLTNVGVFNSGNGPNNYFILEITDQKGLKQYLRFKNILI